MKDTLSDIMSASVLFGSAGSWIDPTLAVQFLNDYDLRVENVDDPNSVNFWPKLKAKQLQEDPKFLKSMRSMVHEMNHYIIFCRTPFTIFLQLLRFSRASSIISFVRYLKSRPSASPCVICPILETNRTACAYDQNILSVLMQFIPFYHRTTMVQELIIDKAQESYYTVDAFYRYLYKAGAPPDLSPPRYLSDDLSKSISTRAIIEALAVLAEYDVLHQAGYDDADLNMLLTNGRTNEYLSTLWFLQKALGRFSSLTFSVLLRLALQAPLDPFHRAYTRIRGYEDFHPTYRLLRLVSLFESKNARLIDLGTKDIRLVAEYADDMATRLGWDTPNNLYSAASDPMKLDFFYKTNCSLPIRAGVCNFSSIFGHTLKQFAALNRLALEYPNETWTDAFENAFDVRANKWREFGKLITPIFSFVNGSLHLLQNLSAETVGYAMREWIAVLIAEDLSNHADLSRSKSLCKKLVKDMGQNEEEADVIHSHYLKAYFNVDENDIKFLGNSNL